MTSMFGEPIARLEDDRLLRGNGGYLDDLGHDALACAFVRSPHAHARVGEIDVGAALDVDGVVAIYTHEDLPDRLAEPLPLLIPHPALTHGRTGRPRRRPAPCTRRRPRAHSRHGCQSAAGRGAGSRTAAACWARGRRAGPR